MIKPRKPIRFFSFFFLFLFFMYLSVRGCSGDKKDVSFVEAEKVLDKIEKKKVVSEELKDFIQDVKKEVKVKKKKISDKEAARKEKEEQARNRMKASDLKKKKASKEKLKIKKQAVTYKKRMSLNLTGIKYSLDSKSKAKVKGALKVIGKNLKKVVITGYYSKGETKSSGSVRAAALKNELVTQGMRPGFPVKILAPSYKNSSFGKIELY